MKHTYEQTIIALRAEVVLLEQQNNDKYERLCDCGVRISRLEAQDSGLLAAACHLDDALVDSAPTNPISESAFAAQMALRAAIAAFGKTVS